MSTYNPKDIEQKWQQYWAEEGLFQASESRGREKCYVLDMFPYPSGDGLHVGHVKGYIATDVYARYQMLRGREVLHPMGWDAFGLPAENYAIANKVHPREAVEKNIARFKEQLSHIGFTYDWSREINTTDPEYYKWTQWIFLQLFKKGLAYESREPINWCPSCKTGLANEDLEDGRCERCGSLVELRPMRQWVLKIREYADALLAGLDELEWPEHIKESQRNWIGRSEGVNFIQRVKDLGIEFRVYDSIPQTFMAQTFTMIAPEHPLVEQLVAGTEYEDPVMKFVDRVRRQKLSGKFDIDTGMEGIFTGRYVEDPFGTGDLPIWISSFVLAEYGTGIVNASAHDERDFAFAKKYDIPLRVVLLPDDESLAEDVAAGEVFYREPDGIIQSPERFAGMKWEESREPIINYIIEEGLGERAVNYKMRDWVFSRQRYWGEPIPIIHCEKCGAVAVPEEDLPVTLPEVESYEPTGTGESPLAGIEAWVHVMCPACGGSAKRETNTMPQWAGSSWYYLRYIDPHNNQQLADLEKEKYWMPVDMYVGGAEHATRHLIYARFWHRFLYDEGVVNHAEPFMRLQNVGLIAGEDGRKMSKRWGNVINPDDVVDTYGADTLRVYEMFMGPFNAGAAWSTSSIAGASRFLERIHRMITTSELLATGISQGSALDGMRHRTIRRVTKGIEEFRFNVAIAALMEWLNELEAKEGIDRENAEVLILLLSPFAPHLAEELWHALGHDNSILKSAWPAWDENMLREAIASVPIQVNGRVRGQVEIATDTDEKSAVKAAREVSNVQKHLEGVEVVKIIYIQGKLINFVVK